MQTPCRVDKQNIRLAGDCGFHGIKNNCSRVCAFCVLDNVAAGAFAPDFQLFGSSGAEGIGSGNHNLVVKQVEIICQFADGSGFANAVNAYNKNNGRSAADARALAFFRKHLRKIFL